MTLEKKVVRTITFSCKHPFDIMNKIIKGTIEFGVDGTVLSYPKTFSVFRNMTFLDFRSELSKRGGEILLDTIDPDDWSVPPGSAGIGDKVVRMESYKGTVLGVFSLRAIPIVGAAVSFFPEQDLVKVKTVTHPMGVGDPDVILKLDLGALGIRRLRERLLASLESFPRLLL